MKVFNWQIGYRSAATTSGENGGPVTATMHAEQLVDDAGRAYLAPEALGDYDEVGEHVDVFSLGAIGYHLFSGRPPAANALELSDKLQETKGLQISSVINGAGENLQYLIQFSTHPDVTLRSESAREFIEDLDKVEKELLDDEHRTWSRIRPRPK